MPRLSKDDYFLNLVKGVALRSTCIRKSVGCILTNARGHILSTGYNGTASGLPNCNEVIHCVGFNLPPGQDKCEAVHAEVNALLQCADVNQIHTVYCTLSPCINCTKMFLNTSAERIVFLEEHTGKTGADLWAKVNRIWQHKAI